MKTHGIPWNQSLSLPFTGPVRSGWPLLAAAIGLSLALLYPLAADAQVQSRNQQRCLIGLNRGLQKVASRQAKEICSCIQSAASGKLGGLIEDCMIADRRGTISRAKQRVISDEAKHCTVPPDFGSTDAATVNDAATFKELDLFHDVFGSDLDVNVVFPIASSPNEAKCQRAIARSVKRCEGAILRSYNTCKRDGLKDGSITSAVDLEACVGADSRGRVARACDPETGRIDREIARRCTARGVDLSDSFPGCATDNPTALSACISNAISRRACLAINTADGISADCDALGKTDVTVANLNILHGLGCGLDGCRQSDRIDLLFEWIVDSGCPDLVTFQEVIEAPVIAPDLNSVPQIDALRTSTCPFSYEFVYRPTHGIDEEIILSRFPVQFSTQKNLFGLFAFRKVLHARVVHPLGKVDVFTTHLASGSDFATNPCGASCPTECVSAGAATIRECQAVQLALFVENVHKVDLPAFITGDFNAVPGTFEYLQFSDRGWTDVYLAAGNPECVPATGVGCTSGRSSGPVAEIESTVPNVDRRIDYIFLVPPVPGSDCLALIDGPGDGDADGTSTKIFADDPNPFSPSCGAAPDPVCWPSDHEGMELDLGCR